LIEGDDLAAARLELLIAGGNAPDDYNRDMTLAELLQQTQDPTDAWVYYQRAIAAKPNDATALEAAGQLAYQVGDYEKAHRMLERALVESAAKHTPLPQNDQDQKLLEDSARIQDLIASPTLPVHDRVDHILADRIIARKRLDACATKYSAPATLPTALQTLSTQWISPSGSAKAAALLADSSLQDSAAQLIYTTETETSQLCGPPTGDDALLLRLATAPRAITLPESTASVSLNVPRD
jgi:tetratricopeptide (TPR) repeat protein